MAAFNFQWEWRGRAINAAHETLGPTRQARGLKAHGRPVLLLPAFSTVSSREEMRPLAERLAAQGCSCMLVDWPGFGESTRGRLSYGPRLYQHFLADFGRANGATARCRPVRAVPLFRQKSVDRDRRSDRRAGGEDGRRRDSRCGYRAAPPHGRTRTVHTARLMSTATMRLAESEACVSELAEDVPYILSFDRLMDRSGDPEPTQRAWRTFTPSSSAPPITRAD